MLDKSILLQLNKTLQSVKVEEISAENVFEDLPEGYYLVEVESAELTISKSSQKPMAAFRFKIVENGIGTNVNENGDPELVEIKAKGRVIFKNYVLGDDKQATRFISDMLKFEGDVEGESLLPREAFTEGEVLEDALEALIGRRIYTQITIDIKDDGTKSSWTNLLSWNRAKQLDLPM